MLEAVEKRFGATRTPHAIEHLSDNGSAYAARETRLFAQTLNLTPCFTPVASSQSNGMSEAFVRTLTRDCIRISGISDAETALWLTHRWIEDTTMGSAPGRHRLARFETLLDDRQLLLDYTLPVANNIHQRINVSEIAGHKPLFKPMLEPVCMYPIACAH